MFHPVSPAPRAVVASLLFLVAVAAGAAGSHAAAAPDPAAGRPADPCTDAAAGQYLRVRTTDGTVLEAAFAGCRGDSLLLLRDEALLAVAAADVDGVWRQARQQRRGVRTGAAVGAGAGGVLFLLLAELVNSVGDGDDVAVAPVTLFGAGLGALVGAGTGLLVGSMVPRWEPLDGGNGAAPHAAPSGGATTGALEMALGAGWQEDRQLRQAGLSGRLGVAAEFPSGIALGLECGRYRVGRQPYAARAGLIATDGAFGDDVCWLAGAVLRYAPLRGDVHPYLLLGAGGYRWNDTFLGVSGGLGVEVRPSGRRLALRAEARRHDNVQNLVDTDPGFTACEVALAYFW